MSSTKAFILIIVVVVLLSLACGLVPNQATPESSLEDAAASIVAATMEAIETAEPMSTSTGEPGAAASPTPVPSSVPTSSPSTPVFQISYVSEGNLWVWREDSAVPLVETGDVTNAYLSDDGQLVAFLRNVDDVHLEIWAVNTDGTDKRRLLSSEDFDAMTTDAMAITTRPFAVDWVPGSHNLAFNTSPLFEGPGLLLNDDLHIIDADSANHRVLLPMGEGGMFYYSPDGEKLTVVTAQSINLLNADGTGRAELLTYDPILTYSEYQYYPKTVWLPDSSGLRVALPPADSLADSSAPTVLWSLPADGSAPVDLLEVVAVPFFEDHPALSPDARQVAYLAPSGAVGDGINDLHIAKLDGSSDIVYDTGEVAFKAWSPDSGRFLYESSGGDLRLGQLGSPPKPLNDTSRIREARWISENEFVSLRFTFGLWQLWLHSLGSPDIMIASSDEEIGEMMRFDVRR
jgi:hypothetical protein